MAGPRKLKDFETTLGYHFKSRTLLNRALTHASIRASKRTEADNERMEFLGDRVLGLAMAEMLVEHYPRASEGDLARRFNRLVRGETCAEVARSIGVGAVLILSESEAGSGGREKETILADAIEALLAAIFMEAGYDAARDVVRRLWKPLIDTSPGSIADPKSALQEWAAGNRRKPPEYRLVERSGPDHAARFTVAVEVKGVGEAEARGSSKQEAETEAAAAFLRKFA